MTRLLIVLLVFLFAEVQGEELPLRVGMELSYPPFEMVCMDGKPCGISVDIAEALGAYLKEPVEIANISFVGLIPSLNSHKIDLVISSITVTERREKAVAFSEPYAKTGLCLLINAGSPVQTVSDVNREDVHVVVKLGTSGEAYAAKHLPKATVRVLDREGMCVLEVIQGKADVFIYDQLSVYRSWQKNLKTTRANLEPFQQELWAIAMRKGDDGLREKVDAFISAYRSEGGFNKLADKYLPAEKAAFEKLGIPFIL